MHIVTLTDGPSEARIAVDRGFNCFSFRSTFEDHTVEVIDSPDDFETSPPKPSSAGIPLLFPFPNRIAGSAFDWEGRGYTLPADKVGTDPNGHAIHGFCLDRPFELVDSSETHVSGRFVLSVNAPERRPHWPADFQFDVTYRLRKRILRLDFTVTNIDDTSLPWGFGTHPYFRLPLGANSRPEDCTIRVPAAKAWVLNDCLPTGERRPVDRNQDLREGAPFGSFTLDDVLTELPEGMDPIEMTIMDETSGLAMTQHADGMFREVVVYTPPDRPSVCLEPYTCVTDAIHLRTDDSVPHGLQTLDPGETATGWVAITIDRLTV